MQESCSWTNIGDAVLLRGGEGQVEGIAVSTELNVLAVSFVTNSPPSVTIALYGLERVHDNELVYKYSFGGGAGAVHVPFASTPSHWHWGMAFSSVAACNKLYVSDWNS
jgi:hypothetical protein